LGLSGNIKRSKRRRDARHGPFPVKEEQDERRDGEGTEVRNGSNIRKEPERFEERNRKGL